MRTFFITLIALFAATAVSAQNWEIDVVRSVNPKNPSASAVWKTVSNTAKPLAVAVPAGMFIASLFEKDKSLRYNACEMAAGLALTTIATAGIKQVVARERPYQRYSGVYPDMYDDARSFPSGHASVAFSTATSLAIQYKKWYITAPAFVWATAVGYSRLYMGQHYPTDILASAVTGAGSALLARWAGRRLFHRPASAASR